MNIQYLSVKKYNEDLFKTPLRLKILCQTFSRIAAHVTHVLNKIGPNAESLYFKITYKVIVFITVLHFRYSNYAKNLE